MSGHVEMDGEVVDSIRGIVTVLLDGVDEPIKCQLAGKMKMNKINVIPGDRVKVKLSPYDLTRGIITLRHKKVKV